MPSFLDSTLGYFPPGLNKDLPEVSCRCYRMKSRKKKGFMEAFCNTYLEFSSNTGIHGLKYVTERGRRVVERVLWVVVAVLGLISAIFMASTFWERFSDSPTRASVETNHYPTWRIPFPAVTLCNANRIFRSRAEELVKQL
ncbi:unnamed protein product [Timema podura]|uniref:Uncharacterized protein n=1 Tax=Timema podura TaxID=61482 RepID=A0ABN7PJ56_TIMPD|nr:unnamed protein product [Timema podura]